MRISKKTCLAMGLVIGVVAQAEMIDTGTSGSTYGDAYGFAIDFDSSTVSDATWTPSLVNNKIYKLNSISVRSGNTENDDLYLGVYRGLSGTTLSGFLGVSDSTANMSGTSGGDLVSWSFANTDIRVKSEANPGSGGDQLFFMFQTETTALTDLADGDRTPIQRASSGYANRLSAILRSGQPIVTSRNPDYAATITMVSNLNNDPEFTTDPFSTSDGVYNVAYSDTIAGSATDPDSDPLTYTKSDGPEWLTIAPDGALSGTPDTSGTNEFTVMVDDGNFGSDTAILQIFIPTIGSPPEFTLDPFSAPDGVYNVDYTGNTIAGSATDHDSDTLTYTNMSGGWLTIAPNGALSGTPNTFETNVFTVVVDDGNGNTDTATLQIYVPSLGTVTDFRGGDLKDPANWTIGLPGDAVDSATITVDGDDGTGAAQGDQWLSGSTTTIGGNATLSMGVDWASHGAVLVTINNATINCTDDFFVQNSAVVLNAGSTTIANDDWEANNYGGRITVNGGIHNSGSGTGHNVGAQGGDSKIGCGVDFLGGTVTAGNFRFQINSTSSVGGSAILASAESGTTFSDMRGLVDFIPGWTGSWEVGSFAPDAWETALTGGGNFTFDGAAIDAAGFADHFIVSTDGTTLTMVAMAPEGIGDISITTLPGGDVEVLWRGATGHTYAVEYKNNLLIDSWLVYTNGVSGTGTITVTVDAPEPETFYRVTGERN